ncbi:conserved hypothetical protein [Trichinella spiralis]|uniref:hypothetical protein n=1 Tax=Trichinella spiralis TaxID=6334 RepID=UPI0001EFC81D|nr:conserved hypothetical protein [Trichinella spiralis]
MPDNAGFNNDENHQHTPPHDNNNNSDAEDPSSPSHQSNGMQNSAANHKANNLVTFFKRKLSGVTQLSSQLHLHHQGRKVVVDRPVYSLVSFVFFSNHANIPPKNMQIQTSAVVVLPHCVMKMLHAAGDVVISACFFGDFFFYLHLVAVTLLSHLLTCFLCTFLLIFSCFAILTTCLTLFACVITNLV